METLEVGLISEKGSCRCDFENYLLSQSLPLLLSPSPSWPPWGEHISCTVLFHHEVPAWSQPWKQGSLWNHEPISAFPPVSWFSPVLCPNHGTLTTTVSGYACCYNKIFTGLEIVIIEVHFSPFWKPTSPSPIKPLCQRTLGLFPWKCLGAGSSEDRKGWMLCPHTVKEERGKERKHMWHLL